MSRVRWEKTEGQCIGSAGSGVQRTEAKLNWKVIKKEWERETNDIGSRKQIERQDGQTQLERSGWIGTEWYKEWENGGVRRLWCSLLTQTALIEVSVRLELLGQHCKEISLLYIYYTSTNRGFHTSDRPFPVWVVEPVSKRFAPFHCLRAGYYRIIQFSFSTKMLPVCN